MRRGTAFLLLGLSGCLWGTGFPLGKVALAELSVAHMILYRLSIATIGLVPFMFFHRPHVQRRDWWFFLLTSFIGVPGVYLVQFWGLARTTVSHAALMVGTLPMVLAIGVVLFTHERLTRVAWIAICCSAVGAILIVLSAGKNESGSHGPTLIGDLAVLVSLVFAAGWIMNNKVLLRRYPPLFVTGMIFILGTSMLACWVVPIYGWPTIHLSSGTWMSLVAQGLFGTTAATMFWNWGLAHVPAAEAGVFTNFEPLVGTILGVTLLGDRLGPLGIVGGVMILGGALYLSRSE
jgi:drug/metabolite transporter (DMT)-like permease